MRYESDFSKWSGLNDAIVAEIERTMLTTFGIKTVEREGMVIRHSRKLTKMEQQFVRGMIHAFICTDFGDEE